LIQHSSHNSLIFSLHLNLYNVRKHFPKIFDWKSDYSYLSQIILYVSLFFLQTILVFDRSLSSLFQYSNSLIRNSWLMFLSFFFLLQGAESSTCVWDQLTSLGQSSICTFTQGNRKITSPCYVLWLAKRCHRYD
jgi:hypothetical protein